MHVPQNAGHNSKQGKTVPGPSQLGRDRGARRRGLGGGRLVVTVATLASCQQHHTVATPAQLEEGVPRQRLHCKCNHTSVPSRGWVSLLAACMGKASSGAARCRASSRAHQAWQQQRPGPCEQPPRAARLGWPASSGCCLQAAAQPCWPGSAPLQEHLQPAVLKGAALARGSDKRVVCRGAPVSGKLGGAPGGGCGKEPGANCGCCCCCWSGTPYMPCDAVCQC